LHSNPNQLGAALLERHVKQIGDPRHTGLIVSQW